MPEEIRTSTQVKEDDYPWFDSNFFPVLNWCGYRARIFLYDASENSYYSYEDFMHSSGESDKKYIIISISFH